VRTLTLLALFMVGCATQPTEAEIEVREYEHAEVFDQWMVCRQIYKDAGVPWFSRWHLSSHRERMLLQGKWIPHIMDMKSDLFSNRCHSILRRAGYK
jgi:hypothetical protein